ncbi:MAG: M23 family metallopeptidase, partial [bacterium]|nr:M23 family metallopeptidase [bacterium]
MVLFIGLVASNVFAAEIANVFRYPVGDENGNGWLLNRRGLQWLDQWDYAGNCGLVYHPGTDFNKDGTSHDGDIGQPVYATANGAVIKSYYESGSSWGNLVLIRHYLPSGEVLFSLYGHLEKRLVSEGDDVAMGQQIGTVGKGIGLSAHLHFEIRKPILFNTAAKYFPCGQDQNFVKLRYFNPESFIKIGRFANMSSAITLKFVERYELKLGVPFQDVGGNIYVHDWDGIMIQNFKNDDETNRYGTDGQTALIYNDDQNKCWLIKEGFWGYYKQNNGPTDFGTPFTDEITAKYANSPFISSGDYVQPGNEIVVQKFQRVNSTERRTLVYNKTSGQSVRRF